MNGHNNYCDNNMTSANNSENIDYVAIIRTITSIDLNSLSIEGANSLVDTYFLKFLKTVDKENLNLNTGSAYMITDNMIRRDLEVDKMRFSQNCTIFHTIKLFFCAKYLSQVHLFDRTIEEAIYTELVRDRAEYSHYILWPYLYKLTSRAIPDNYLDLKTALLENFGINLAKNLRTMLPDSNYTLYFFLNEIAFIHFNEFVVLQLKNKSEEQQALASYQLSLLYIYFIWKSGVRMRIL